MYKTYIDTVSHYTVRVYNVAVLHTLVCKLTMGIYMHQTWVQLNLYLYLIVIKYKI